MRSRHSQLLCVTSGTVHPSLLAQWALVAWLRRLPGVRVHVVHSVEAVRRLQLERYATMLFYFHTAHISDEALSRIEQFVESGGGLVAVHSASASFKDSSAYTALLGGRFLHHGPILPYEVRQTSSRGSFAGGGSSEQHVAANPGQGAAPHLAPDFREMPGFTITDELYIHEYDPDNFVHFVVDTEDGPEPVVWSRLHGTGRVFYLAPGHRAESVRHPAVRNILRLGIRWAMDRDSAE